MFTSVWFPPLGVSVLDMELSVTVGLIALSLIMLRRFGPRFAIAAPEQDWSE